MIVFSAARRAANGGFLRLVIPRIYTYNYGGPSTAYTFGFHKYNQKYNVQNRSILW